MVLASNAEIPDYSLEQYRGNVPNANANGAGAQFLYHGIPLGLFEYARASMSNGGYAFNPVYELKATLVSLCGNADREPEPASRAQAALMGLHHDLSEMISLWEKRDLRVVYDGRSLKETLGEIYADGAKACSFAMPDTTGKMVAATLAQIAARTPEMDIQDLIAGMNDTAPFAGMRPVGY
jgi:hypothetical protein